VDQARTIPAGHRGRRIVTNDRFRDWAEAHPEILEPGFLIWSGMRDGKVWLKGLQAVPTVAR
jgi:hypothetical protein